MADLPTNLKDDILDSSVNTRRKYRMIENGDGTYSFEDLTEYNQVGDEYGAGLINETNRQVNERVEKAVVVRDLETIGAITQPGFVPDALALKDVNDSLGGLRIGYDSASGKYGYWKKEADTEVFVPFSSADFKLIKVDSFTNQNKTYNNCGDNVIVFATIRSGSNAAGAIFVVQNGEVVTSNFALSGYLNISYSNGTITIKCVNTYQTYIVGIITY